MQTTTSYKHASESFRPFNGDSTVDEYLSLTPPLLRLMKLRKKSLPTPHIHLWLDPHRKLQEFHLHVRLACIVVIILSHLPLFFIIVGS
jgi:hypothetical protein